MKMFFDMLSSQNEAVVLTMSGLSGPTYEELHAFISKNLQFQLQVLNVFRVLKRGRGGGRGGGGCRESNSQFRSTASTRTPR